jgi:DNA-binding LacI/PurR family transcriptional regulator
MLGEETFVRVSKRMANLREVAELAGVSSATASMALRGGREPSGIASFERDVNDADLKGDYGAQLVAELFAKQDRRRVAMINGPAQHLDAVERDL